MPYFTRVRRPSCDLEPVEAQEAPAPEEQPGTTHRRRAPARDRIERLLAARPGFWRLTPSEQREHTDDRTNRLEALMRERERAEQAHTATDLVTLADDVARAWGLSADDRSALRPFAQHALASGLDDAVAALDASYDVDNRLRCAIALVLQTTFPR